jgi:hypothetical protein
MNGLSRPPAASLCDHLLRFGGMRVEPVVVTKYYTDSLLNRRALH